MIDGAMTIKIKLAYGYGFNRAINQSKLGGGDNEIKDDKSREGNDPMEFE